MSFRKLIIIVLVISAGIVVLLMLGAKNETIAPGQNTSDEITPAKQVVGGDKDEHGCIPSAGYSWCESKNKCLRVWEEPCIGENDKDRIDEIKSQIKKALIAKHGEQVNDLTISVSKIEGNYAQGGASAVGLGGGMWFAAKVGESWELVWDGNGVVQCDSLKNYPGFPVSFIPECFDAPKGEMVKR